MYCSDSGLVSVIILSYKRFDYLYGAIQSVIDQNYPCIELIIADDGSVSFPQKEIECFINNKTRSNIISTLVYSNEENYGTVKNLNEAIKKSQGSYIVPLSHDDVLFDCDVLMRIVDRLKHSKTGIITCRRIMCDSNLKPIRLMPTDQYIKFISRFDTCNKQHSAFIRGEYYEMASGSCTYYSRKRLFDDNLFDERYHLLEDWTHYIRITRSILIETAYDIKSIYYRSGGISSTMSPILREDYLKILEDELSNNKDSISVIDYRYVKFNYLRIKKNSLILASILYPDSFLLRLIYKIKCDLYSRQGCRDYYKEKND